MIVQSDTANVGGDEFLNVSFGSSTFYVTSTPPGGSSTSYSAATAETIEWAKFAMWLRGFLSALEGKEFTTEDRDKIMEKLSSVDPESQGWRYSESIKLVPRPPYQTPSPWRPIPGPTAMPYSSPTTAAWEEQLEKLKVFCDKQKDSNGG